MDKTDNEVELLKLDIGGQKLAEMTAISFLQYVAKKLNNTTMNTATSAELRMMVSNPPMGRTMPDDEKIRIIRKLKSLNVEIP